MQPSMHFLFAKETFHNLITLTTNTNNKTIYLLPPKTKKQTFTSPLFSKHPFPIHQPTHKCLFSLQKEVQSHACKPVLGFSLPKMGYDHFCKWLRVQFSFRKVLVLFSKKCLQNKISFLQRGSFQMLTLRIQFSFCKGLLSKYLILFAMDFSKSLSFSQRIF